MFDQDALYAQEEGVFVDALSNLSLAVEDGKDAQDDDTDEGDEVCLPALEYFA